MLFIQIKSKFYPLILPKASTRSVFALPDHYKSSTREKQHFIVKDFMHILHEIHRFGCIYAALSIFVCVCVCIVLPCQLRFVHKVDEKHKMYKKGRKGRGGMERLLGSELLHWLLE